MASTNEIPRWARYDHANKKAVEFLERYNITDFPIDPFEIIRVSKWGLLKYSGLANSLNCNLDDIITVTGSDLGITQWSSTNYTIAYNDMYEYQSSIPFTLMHEIGHIYLKHFVDFPESMRHHVELKKTSHKSLEIEADVFARNVLAPTVMYYYLEDKSSENVSAAFGISLTAADVRIDRFENDKNVNQRHQLSLRLQKLYKNFRYKQSCYTCFESLKIQNGYYCPICKSKTLRWGNGKMKHEGLALHVNGKPKNCPDCRNEETNIDGAHCQICSIYLLNKCNEHLQKNCTNEETFPGNYRYCPECAAPSTFLHFNYLKEWNHEEPVVDAFANIPDGDGIDELPFN